MKEKDLSQSFRSMRSQMLFKIGAVKNFALFTGKHLWSLFLIKAYSFSNKGLQHSCFFIYIAKFLSTALFIEHLRRLLLKLNNKLWLFQPLM